MTDELMELGGGPVLPAFEMRLMKNDVQPMHLAELHYELIVQLGLQTREMLAGCLQVSAFVRKDESCCQTWLLVCSYLARRGLT